MYVAEMTDFQILFHFITSHNSFYVYVCTKKIHSLTVFQQEAFSLILWSESNMKLNHILD